LGLLEKRSYLADRIGQQVADEKITIRDDPLDLHGLPKAFDFEGTPKHPVVLIEDGIARGVVWDRTTAARARNGASTTGHAGPVESRDWGPGTGGRPPTRSPSHGATPGGSTGWPIGSATGSTSPASTTWASSTRAAGSSPG